MILEHKDEIIQKCNEKDPVLVKFGGGAREVEVRVIDSMVGPMVIVHLLVDTLDARVQMQLIQWQKQSHHTWKKLLVEPQSFVFYPTLQITDW